ncbi:hypothetical protein N7497_000279 [Penicillium chrysogenum]|nr:hypothetical protein N7497_000279 [Penicillium chrysogenum]
MDFPTDVAEFDNDPRISFSRPDNSYLLETSDGREFLFNSILKRWVESIDEALIRKQQGYGSDDGDAQVVHPRDRKKRKNLHDETDEPKVKKPRVNTAVWVTNIPRDAELSEIRDLFSKYGILAEEVDTGKPRIKMYTDEDGNFNGDVLVVYFKPESVDLAIKWLDETDFRLGPRDPNGPMRVQVADFSYKREQDSEPKVMTAQEKKKFKERAERLNKKLSDWGDDEAENVMAAMKAEEEARRHVVLKNMFTLAELEEDPLASIEIQEDIERESALRLAMWPKWSSGTAKLMEWLLSDLWHRPTHEMSGRQFSGNPVHAYIWDGEEKFNKYHPRRDAEGKKVNPLDADEDEEARLERFGDWLESRGNQKTDKNHETDKVQETQKVQETGSHKTDNGEHKDQEDGQEHGKN